MNIASKLLRRLRKAVGVLTPRTISDSVQIRYTEVLHGKADSDSVRLSAGDAERLGFEVDPALHPDSEWITTAGQIRKRLKAGH